MLNRILNFPDIRYPVELNIQYKATEFDQIIINYTMHTFNIAQEIIDTTDRLTGLQQAKDVEREAYEAQLQQLRTEYKETKEQLISENIVIGKIISS